VYDFLKNHQFFNFPSRIGAGIDYSKNAVVRRQPHLQKPSRLPHVTSQTQMNCQEIADQQDQSSDAA
jgi:hypothetical protein